MAFDTINHDYCAKNCITMVFETLLWNGLNVILKTELSSSSLAPLDPTTGKSHVVFHRVRFRASPVHCVC